MAILTTYPRISDPFKQGAHSGLDFAHGVGIVRDDNNITRVEAGTVTLADGTESYIEVDAETGAVTANAVGYTSGKIPLFKATTSGGYITEVEDDRAFLATGAADVEVQEHDNTKHTTNLVGEAGVINAMTEKQTIVDNDLLVIEDSENANNAKKLKIENLPKVDIEKKSATQETTASVSAVGSESGSIDIDVSQADLLMVKVNPAENIDGFKFQLYSEELETNLIYELDTSQDEEYVAGAEVRDPNNGFLPVCFYIDADELNKIWYKVENLDTETASTFTIDIDYKGVI